MYDNMERLIILLQTVALQFHVVDNLENLSIVMEIHLLLRVEKKCKEPKNKGFGIPNIHGLEVNFVTTIHMYTVMLLFHDFFHSI